MSRIIWQSNDIRVVGEDLKEYPTGDEKIIVEEYKPNVSKFGFHKTTPEDGHWVPCTNIEHQTFWDLVHEYEKELDKLSLSDIIFCTFKTYKESQLVRRDGKVVLRKRQENDAMGNACWLPESGISSSDLFTIFCELAREYDCNN